MIDYLEQLFLIEAGQTEGGEEIPALHRRYTDSEPVEFRTPAVPDGERVERVVLGRAKPDSEPVQDPDVYSAVQTARRQEIPDGAQALERRLRRDSRRYDSGFYRY